MAPDAQLIRLTFHPQKNGVLHALTRAPARVRGVASTTLDAAVNERQIGWNLHVRRRREPRAVAMLTPDFAARIHD
jgi:hypothetical protein